MGQQLLRFGFVVLYSAAIASLAIYGVKWVVRSTTNTALGLSFGMSPP